MVPSRTLSLRELHYSPESVRGHEVCVYNIWENLECRIVLTHRLKGVRISGQYIYRMSSVWGNWAGMMNTSGFINAEGWFSIYLKGGQDHGEYNNMGG